MDWTTHQVFNQFPELGDYDPLASDPALCGALARADAGWARPALDSYARRLGRAETYTLAQQANRHAPELHRYPNRTTLLFLSGFLLFMVWALGVLVYYSLRDRR